MLQLYKKWNRIALKALWLLTAIGLVASVPLIMNRIEMEQSSDKVEFVFDYRDLLEISDYKTEPAWFVEEQLDKMKEAGVTALAVYESTLDELELSGGIKLYSAEEAALLNGNDDMQQSNQTYLLFADDAAAAALEPVVREGFGLFDIGVEPWSYNGKNGLAIDTGEQEAKIIPLDPDPLQMAVLQKHGFRISVRLSDSRPYDHDRMDALLGRLTSMGADTVIFAGKRVTGTAEDANKLALTSMAELLNKYGLRFAVIEQPLSKQQSGIGKLAYLSGYQAVRLHSILEEEAVTDAKVLADRFVLAVKDRNFRMIYLNARMKVDREQAEVSAPLDNVFDSLQDPDYGAIKRIKDLGYETGAPEPFKQVNPGWEQLVKALVFLGAVALIARMAGYFLPKLTLLIFVFGLGCTAALYVLSPTIAVQALAMFAAVSAPTAAVIVAMQAAQKRAGAKAAAGAGVHGGSLPAFGFGIGLFVRTVLLSLVGAVYTVALLNHISYLLVLNQFRGVSVLHTLPIVLAALYAMFFHGTDSLWQVAGNVKRFFLLNIKVVWVLAAAVGGVAFIYYLSRTGNQGTVLPIDRAFRALLENTLGIRPRTKELITHPLFIMGIFLFVRYGKRAALALVVAGTMGQLSAVDTFAHLHSPLWISALRVLYGAVIGAGIALVYFAAWELLVRGWRRWRNLLLPQE